MISLEHSNCIIPGFFFVTPSLSLSPSLPPTQSFSAFSFCHQDSQSWRCIYFLSFRNILRQVQTSLKQTRSAAHPLHKQTMAQSIWQVLAGCVGVERFPIETTLIYFTLIYFTFSEEVDKLGFEVGACAPSQLNHLRVIRWSLWPPQLPVFAF